MPLRSYFLVVTPCLLALLYLSDQIFDPIVLKTVTASSVTKLAEPPLEPRQAIIAQEPPVPLMEVVSSHDDQVPPLPPQAIPAPASEANASQVARPQRKKAKLRPQKSVLRDTWRNLGGHEPGQVW
jgi:hypothetical protein